MFPGILFLNKYAKKKPGSITTTRPLTTYKT